MAMALLITARLALQPVHLYQWKRLSSTAPMDETDHDGDGFAECEYAAASWAGSPSVVGGEDCNDLDAFVFPEATEYCDGQYNDCADPGIAVSTAPDDERDDDGDGFIECTFTNGVPWAPLGAVPSEGDCDDQDITVYPLALELCDGQYNDCEDNNYDASGAPDNESDLDNDGYVDCDDDGATWAGAVADFGLF